MRKLGFTRNSFYGSSTSYDNDQYSLFKYNSDGWTVGEFLTIGKRDYLDMKHIKTFQSFKEAKQFLINLLKSEV